MRRVGERIPPAVTQEESLSGHDVQNNSSSVTAVPDTEQPDKPDKNKDTKVTPQGLRKKG